MKRWRQSVSILCISFALAGCAGGMGSLFAPSAMETFNLNGIEGASLSRRGSSQLIVSEPMALRVYDGERIVVKPSSGEVNYLAGAQWSDRLPKLIQARLVESFDRSGLFKAVARPGEGLDADLALHAEIRSFELHVGANSGAVIELSLRLVSARTGRALKTTVVEAREPLVSDEPRDATAALDRAFHKLQLSTIEWIKAAR